MTQVFKITKPSPSVIFISRQEPVLWARRQKITVRYSIAVDSWYIFIKEHTFNPFAKQITGDS